MFVNAGYLTVTKEIDLLKGKYRIEIPNKEVKQEFIKLTEYQLGLSSGTLDTVTESLAKEDQETFLESYQEILMVPSYHDLQKENSYHMMMLGMCLCLNKNLIQVNDKLLMWELPIEIFKKFKEVIILTYLFEGSVQKPYFDSFDIEYKLQSVKDGELIPYEETSVEDKQKIISLINMISTPSLDMIGLNEYDLSSTWYRKNLVKPIYVERLKNNLSNFFKNIAKATTKQTMWSTFKEYKNKLKGKGYTKSFCQYNIRATNDYRHCSALAYLLNVFPHTSLTMYFNEKGLKEINKDKYALSILLQWIWRSRIRNIADSDENRKIDLYLPSRRMQHILMDWLSPEA